MTFKTSIEDLIVQELQSGPQQITALVDVLQEHRKGTTKQGVYRVIRKLKKEERIVVYKKKASLNYVWVQKMERFFNLAEQHYSGGTSPGNDFLFLQDGERVSYSFRTSQALDQFWSHAFAVLADRMQKDIPIMLYNPHEWFWFARSESERGLFNNIKNARRFLFLATGHKDPLDKVVRDQFDGTFLQCALAIKTPFKSNQYLNIFDDFVIEVFLDKKIASKIDALYKTEKQMTPENKKVLEELLVTKGSHRFTISRNVQKAAALRQRLGKHFYIPKESRGYFKKKSTS